MCASIKETNRILSFEQLTKVNKDLKTIIEENQRESIEEEGKQNLKDIPEKEKRNYIDHLSSLFLNALLIRVKESGQDAKEKSIEARLVISDLNNNLP